jgi:hypothetical protein
MPAAGGAVDVAASPQHDRRGRSRDLAPAANRGPVRRGDAPAQVGGVERGCTSSRLISRGRPRLLAESAITRQRPAHREQGYDAGGVARIRMWCRRAPGRPRVDVAGSHGGAFVRPGNSRRGSCARWSGRRRATATACARLPVPLGPGSRMSPAVGHEARQLAAAVHHAKALQAPICAGGALGSARPAGPAGDSTSTVLPATAEAGTVQHRVVGGGRAWGSTGSSPSVRCTPRGPSTGRWRLSHDDAHRDTVPASISAAARPYPHRPRARWK